MSGTPILMPKLGLTMTEGMLASWLVKAGDAVKAGDPLFVVETDKIANEVEARGEGTILSIDVAEGETVAVGATLARWTGSADADEAPAADPSGAVPAATPVAIPAVETPPAAPAPVAPASGGTRVFATPLARRMARDGAIDLGAVTGSGPRGRVKAIDVERHRQAAPVAAPASAPPPAPASPVAFAGERRAASQIERTVARRLTESKQTIPHFYVFADADLTRLKALRGEINALGGAKVSVSHCIVAAVAHALGKMPELNAVWDGGDIVTGAAIDIGLAVDTPRGLLVPVIRDLRGAPLSTIAARADALVARARDGRLGGDDLAGGAIAVSNVGMYGASFLAPIINPGQSAILGVGAPKQVFRPDAEGRPELREEVGLVLACDHRIHDGVRAATLLNHIVGALEQPLRLLLS